MKKIILLVVAMVMTFGVADLSAASKAKKKEYATTTLAVHLHCQECVKRAMNYVPYQKGVKDVNIDFEKKLAEVKYDSRKTNVEGIIKAFGKVDIEAHIYKDKAAKKKGGESK